MYELYTWVRDRLKPFACWFFNHIGEFICFIGFLVLIIGLVFFTAPFPK